RPGLQWLASSVIRRWNRGWTPPDEFATYVVIAFVALCALVALVALHGGRLRKEMAAISVELLVLTLIGYITYQTREATAEYRLTGRNFYGALRIRDSGPPAELLSRRTLTHGTINHGEQYLNPARRRLSTTYYGPNTGVGLAIREKEKNGAVRVGVIGLGTGT